MLVLEVTSLVVDRVAVTVTVSGATARGVDVTVARATTRAVGVDLDIKPGVGPVVASPVRTMADVEAIPDLAPDDVDSLVTL